MKKLKAHLADYRILDTGEEAEIVVALCEKHSDSLITKTESLLNRDTSDCIIKPGAVENHWNYPFNRCELCPEDHDKDFLRE